MIGWVATQNPTPKASKAISKNEAILLIMRVFYTVFRFFRRSIIISYS